MGAVFRSILLAVAIVPAAVSAQDVTDWQTLQPQGEEFSIIMPKGTTFETGKMQYHKMELSTRLYLYAPKNGPIAAVVSLSGIKSNPALYSEMQRINSYVDAFKDFLSPKLEMKDAVARLTMVGPKALSGHAGREYRMTIGQLSGPLQVFATKRRFYAVVLLTSKKDEALEQRFLSSFTLPEKIVEPPPKVAVQEPPKPEEPASGAAAKAAAATGTPTPAQEAGAEAKEEAKSDTPASNTAGQRSPISGGVLNAKAITLPKPDYPADARAARATGTVVVQVVVDEYGNVTTAKAISGPPLLQQPSVAAALQAKFAPTTLMGEPVKVTGVLTFNFVL